MKYPTAVMMCSVFRPDKLRGAIESVPEQYRVVVAGWDEATDKPDNVARDFEFYAMPGASICERSWHNTQLLEDYNIIGMCDDTKLFGDTIRLAEQRLDETFGEDRSADAVCGIKAIALPPTEPIPQYAFCVYGKEWLDRFQDRKMFCPDYERFVVDREWWLMANTIDRFVYCDKALIYHLPEDGDKTHHLGDRNALKVHDIQAFNNRRKRQLIWGLNDHVGLVGDAAEPPLTGFVGGGF
jgi:hypothetical protein